MRVGRRLLCITAQEQTSLPFRQSRLVMVLVARLETAFSLRQTQMKQVDMQPEARQVAT
jgi:hypothetical protein